MDMLISREPTNMKVKPLTLVFRLYKNHLNIAPLVYCLDA